MFACGVPMLPKIILRKTVLIQGGVRATKHTSVGIWRWGRALQLGEILQGSPEEREALGLDSTGASECRAAVLLEF